MLRFNNGAPFTTGVCTYRFRPATEMDITPRIMVPLTVGGLPTEAAIDTGGIYLICPPEYVELIGLDPSAGIEESEILFRNTKVQGTLHKIIIQFQATDGDTCDLQVTALAASANPHQQWDGLPIFLGMQNCLEALRFAIEPTLDDGEGGNFHFAPAWDDL